MLKGQIAFITGGGSGIGRSACQLFAKEGASVVAADINEKAATETVKGLSGSNHLAQKLDVSKTEDIKRCINEIKNKYSSPPTAVVNSAGVHVMGNLIDMTEDDYDRVMTINLKGSTMVTILVCKELVAAKKKGSIINIASSACTSYYANNTLYAASKAAINTFSKSAGKDMAEHGVRINCIVPGLINTPLISGISTDVLRTCLPPAQVDNMAEPIEVAKLLLFLASDQSSFVNGSSYSITGGYDYEL